MAGTQLESKGLMAGLFDLDFRQFITLRFIKVIYVLVMAVIALVSLVFFGALASRGAGPAVVALVIVPVSALFYLILARVYLELIALLFRIAENTARIAEALAGPAGPPAGGPGRPPGPPGGGSGRPPGPPPGYGPPPAAGPPAYGPPPSYGPPPTYGSSTGEGSAPI